ncbi:MAG: trypsin-like peptidase domain-containing protein [Planctomycetes bacterium]|nr:trypsin-like peptidase domain-containing protein [Planctomycetota bacterium]
MSLLIAPLLLAAAQLPGDEDLVARFGDRLTVEARVYQMAGPSVVSIDVFGTVSRFGLFQQQPVRTQLGQGTGVVIDPSGLVITNAHVAAPFEPGLEAGSVEMEIAFGGDFGGARFKATVLNIDREWDLALLRIEAEGPFRAIPIEDSGELLIGEKVITIGTPYGNDHSITSGILSGMRRDVAVRTADGGRANLSGLIQTDAAINPGNSGGPLLNAYGQLIGINSATLMAADGIGYAIPVDRVREILGERLLDADRSTRFWAGMRVKENGRGLVVSELHPRGPAALAGLQRGDRLLRIDGAVIGSLQDYAARLLGHAAGEEVPLVVLDQAGEERQVELGLLPPELRETLGLLGFDARPDRITYRRGWQNRVMQVVRLTRVYRDTTAERLGLRVGDIVVAVRTTAANADDGWVPVRTMAELVSLVRGPDFKLDGDNIWVLRDEESFKGRLVFDDPDLAKRYREG